MVKPKLKKVLPVLLSGSMVFSMISPLMAVPLQAAEPTEQTEIPSDNVDLGESADVTISEDFSKKDVSVRPSNPGSRQSIQEGQPDSESSLTVPEEECNGSTQTVTEEPVVQDAGEETKESQAETRLTVNINNTAYTVSSGQEFADAVSEKFTSLADITSVEFMSGTVTEDDLGYFKTNKSKLTGLQTLKINLDSDLTFEGGTVLPDSIFNVTSGLKSLTTVEIAGFTEIGASALKINALTSISMPDVKVIGTSAFSGCKNLTSVDLKNVENIGDKAFEKTGITKVTVLSGKNYGKAVFSDCTNLESADLNGMKEVPDSMFDGCSSLTLVTMPDVETVGLNAFYGCSDLSLNNDVISQFKTIRSGAFNGCKAITGTLDLSGATLDGTGFFKNCKGITEVNLSGHTAVPDSSFYGCTALETVNFNGVTTIGENAFYNCKALTKLELPDTLTIGKSAFSGCSAVTEVNMSKVETIEASAFASIKNEVHVTAGMETPPEVDGTPFANALAGSTLTVPAGTLEKYLPDTQIGAYLTDSSDTCWAKSKLQVVDNEYVTLTYTDTLKYPVPKYQILKKGQSIGEEPFTSTRNGYKLNGIYTDKDLTQPEGGVNSDFVPEKSGTLYFDWGTITVKIADKDGKVIKEFELPTDTYNELDTLYPELPDGALQWNTAADGSGQVILADTKIYDDVTLYPIYDDIINVTVKINGSEDIGAANLGLAFAEADVDTVTEVEIVSGKLTLSDYDWMNNGFMETVEKLVIAEGVESEDKTVPSGTAVNAPNLKYLEIHGVEKLENAAIMAHNLETVILPDVKEIGANGLGTFSTSSTTVKMTTVEMPNIESLGNSVFSHQDQLTDLNFPKLTYIGDNCFNACGKLRISVNQIPETGTSPFGKDSSLAEGSVLVVPADVYDSYVEKNGSDSFEGINLEKGAELTTVSLTINTRSGYTAHSVEDAVQKVIEEGRVEKVSDIYQIRFDGGVIKETDFSYIRENMPDLSTLLIKQNADIKFIDAHGNESYKVPDKAFFNMKNLKMVELNEWFTEIGTSAFEGTDKLSNLKLGDVSVIGDNAFAIQPGTGNKMTTISSSNVKTIGANAFAGRENLTNVTFRYVEDIGDRAFYNLPKIKSFAIYTYLKSIGTEAFAVQKGTETAEFTLYITYADRIDYNLPEIADNAFENRAEAGGILDYDNTADETKISLMDEALRNHPGYDDASNTWFGFELLEKKGVISVVIDGAEISGSSLEDAVEKSGIDADDITSIEFVAGTITQDDLTYLKEQTTYLETLKMNLSDSLKLVDENGTESTVLPGKAFQKTRLETVELGGFTEIKGMAFQGCQSLASVSMPDIEIIGQDAFYHTDDYENIVLPGKIRELNDCGFGVAGNGTKTIHVTMEGSEPPQVTGTVFSRAGSDSYVTVPEGSLENYLPGLDLSKYFGTAGETKWNSLRVEDPLYNLITYKGENSWEIKYAYVKQGEMVTEDRIPVFDKEGFELSGWNTAKDGMGTSLTADTVPTEPMTVYAQWEEPKEDVLTVKINGTQISGSSLEDAVKDSKTEVKDLTDLEIISGIVTQDDLDYISQLTYVESFTMNLGEGLAMYNKDGNLSTVLGENANVLKFADEPKGWSKPAIRNVTLGGITEIYKGGLTAKSAETVNMPDVEAVGDSAFSQMSWLEELNIENAVTVGKSAFFNCKRLTDITMNKVETLGEGAFKYTNSLKKMTLPESIKTIEDIEFGVTTQGNKNGTAITIKAQTPPTVEYGAFKGVASSGGKYSTVTVPHGALAAYVYQINPKADVTKVLKISDTIWNNLYLREEGSYLVEYSTGNSWETQFAYVTMGETLTEDQIAGYEVEGQILTGWSTEKDGTGDMLTEGTLLTGDIKVYPVMKEAVTLTVHVGDEVTEIPVVKGEAIGDKLPADPVMEGYIFKGWNTQKDGKGEAVTAETKADSDMDIYAVFEEEPVVIFPDISSVTAENGKVTVVLSEKPTNAPDKKDLAIQMNLNGSGNKDIEIIDFTYDGDKTIVITIDEIAETEQQQTFTVTVTMEGKSVTSNEVIVDARDDGKDPGTDHPGTNKPGTTPDTTDKAQNNKESGNSGVKAAGARTGDDAKTVPFAAAGATAAVVIAGIVVWKRKKTV